MERVKEVTMKDVTDDGQFRILKVGENEVHVMVLVANPDGVFYSVKGDKPGRHFLPMHMIAALEMEADVTS